MMSSEEGMIVPPYFISQRNDKEIESREEFLTQAELFDSFTPILRQMCDQILTGTSSLTRLPHCLSVR